MNKILTTALTISFILSLTGPVLAAPTWVPEYKDGVVSYVNPELGLPSLQDELIKASKPHGINFINISTIKGDDLPPTGYAKVVNDRFISKWGSVLGSNYITLVYVRDTNPLKGSFSMNAGSDFRETFGADELNAIQKPVLKRYMPQDPSGAIVTIAATINEKVSFIESVNTLLGGAFVLILGGIGLFMLFTLIVIYLESKKNLKKGWGDLDAMIAANSDAFTTVVDELKFIDVDKLNAAQKSHLENANEKALTVGKSIERIYQEKISIKSQTQDNLNLLIKQVNDVTFILNGIASDIKFIKSDSITTPKSFYSVATPTRPTPTRPSTPSKPPSSPKPAPKPTYASRETVVVQETTDYWGRSSGSSGSSYTSNSSNSNSSSSSNSDSGSSSYDYGSSSSSDSSSYDSGSSDSSSSDW